MLFAFPVLFAPVFLFNLEIIIRAVIIKDLIISLPQEMAVLIDLCLNKGTFRPKDIQRAVYIVKLIGRFFQKFRCGLIGRMLAAGFQDPCINQIRENCIDSCHTPSAAASDSPVSACFSLGKHISEKYSPPSGRIRSARRRFRIKSCCCKEGVIMKERLTKKDVEKIQQKIDHRKLVVRPEAIEAVKEARA